MTITFKLEREDGTPAEPASFRTSVYRWSPGDVIPLGATRSLRVVRVKTRTPTSRLRWSLRTWPKERLAPEAEPPPLRGARGPPRRACDRRRDRCPRMARTASSPSP